MDKIMSLGCKAQSALNAPRAFDFLGPLALRLYLAPIFILAGSNKLANAENVGYWFASLGIPAPELMAYVAGLTELVGGIALIIGLAVRWLAIPLMFTLRVRATRSSQYLHFYGAGEAKSGAAVCLFFVSTQRIM